MKPIVYTLMAAAAILLAASCSVMCKKKNNFKNTRWSCEYQEFVADAGNETVNVTLEFISATEFKLETKAQMPPYPAMYMNSDGTVDTMPGWSREYTINGTYSVAGNVVTLVYENGETHNLTFLFDNLISSDISYQTLTLTRESDK